MLLQADILPQLVATTVDVALVVVFVGIGLCVLRLLKGPHLADRAIALDTIAVHLIALLLLLSMRFDSLLLFDGALVLSLLGFTGTVAVAYYIARPHLGRGARVNRDPDD
jgi:multicomponent K+:H+ antiporter subunit F